MQPAEYTLDGSNGQFVVAQGFEVLIELLESEMICPERSHNSHKLS